MGGNGHSIIASMSGQFPADDLRDASSAGPKKEVFYGTCKVYPAPYGIYIKDDDRHFVMPDISVICDKDKIEEKGCLGAPDFVIEIVSPSSRCMDYVRKLKLYQEAGVREYWIVDPQIKTVTVYHPEHGAEAVKHPFSEKIRVGIYEDLYLSLADWADIIINPSEKF